MRKKTGGDSVLDDLKKYNLRKTVFDIAEAWNLVKTINLVNGWNQLLKGTEAWMDFDGFEPELFVIRSHHCGETDVTEESVINWLETDQDDPGYHHLTEEEIAASVSSKPIEQANTDESSSKLKLSAVRCCADTIVEWIDQTDLKGVQPFYATIRQLRDKVIIEQNARYVQPKIHDFFKIYPRPRKISKSSSIDAQS